MDKLKKDVRGILTRFGRAVKKENAGDVAQAETDLLNYIQAIQVQARVSPKTADTEIIEWHKWKFPTADKWDVYRKLLEEVGELGEAIARENYNNIELEFGDVNICLIVLEHKLNLNREKAVDFSHSKNLAKEPI